MKKGERLKSKKEIGRLFKEGKTFGVYPLRLFWVEMNSPKSDYPVQFSLSVPKKKFPKAVHRNFLRRRIREAYRLNRHYFYNKLSPTNNQYGFMILYTGKEALSYHEIEKAMKRLLRKFIKIQK